MKLSISTATFAAFAAMGAPFASAQPSASFAPSAADDSFAPSTEESNTPSFAFGSIAPSFFESNTSGPSESLAPSGSESAACSANPVCSALFLDGDCCPTIDNVFLTCCSDDSAAPSSEVEDLVEGTPAPSPAESAAPSDSIPLSFDTEDSIAPSDADEEESSAPSSTATSIAGPPQSTPPADLLVSITPINYEGCVEDEPNVSIDKIFLKKCDPTKPEQKFKYDGALFRTGSNEDKCLQAGYDGEPAEGEFVRIDSCDSTNSLQKFTWDFGNGFIRLTDFPGFCLSFRGINDNVGLDPILVKKCELTDFEGTTQFEWGVPS